MESCLIIVISADYHVGDLALKTCELLCSDLPLTGVGD